MRAKKNKTKIGMNYLKVWNFSFLNVRVMVKAGSHEPCSRARVHGPWTWVRFFHPCLRAVWTGHSWTRPV